MLCSELKAAPELVCRTLCVQNSPIYTCAQSIWCTQPTHSLHRDACSTANIFNLSLLILVVDVFSFPDGDYKKQTVVADLKLKRVSSLYNDENEKSLIIRERSDFENGTDHGYDGKSTAEPEPTSGRPEEGDRRHRLRPGQLLVVRVFQEDLARGWCYN